MDYTQSDHYVVDASTGHRRHDLSGPIPTQVSDKDLSSVIWSLMEIVNASGRAPQQFDPAVPATYQVLLNACKDLFPSNSRLGHTYTSPDWLYLDKANNVILQYGPVTSLAASGTVAVTFTAAFSGTPFFAGALPTSTTAFAMTAESAGTGGMTVRNGNNATPVSGNWFAIGVKA